MPQNWNDGSEDYNKIWRLEKRVKALEERLKRIEERSRIIVANSGWGDGRLLNFAEDIHTIATE